MKLLKISLTLLSLSLLSQAASAKVYMCPHAEEIQWTRASDKVWSAHAPQDWIDYSQSKNPVTQKKGPELSFFSMGARGTKNPQYWTLVCKYTIENSPNHRSFEIQKVVGSYKDCSADSALTYVQCREK